MSSSQSESERSARRVLLLEFVNAERHVVDAIEDHDKGRRAEPEANPGDDDVLLAFLQPRRVVGA